MKWTYGNIFKQNGCEIVMLEASSSCLLNLKAFYEQVKSGFWLKIAFT
jgi:hypothetical protein